MQVLREALQRSFAEARGETGEAAQEDEAGGRFSAMPSNRGAASMGAYSCSARQLHNYTCFTASLRPLRHQAA